MPTIERRSVIPPSERVTRIRTMLVVVLLIVAVVAVATGGRVYRIRSFDAAHAKITRQTGEAGVVDLMGTPERVETNVGVAFWDGAILGDAVAGRVVKRYWYTAKLPPVPISWTIGFDANGRVISKHRWD